jgi:hypothetical protein
VPDVHRWPWKQRSKFAAMFFNVLLDLSHPLDALIAEGEKVRL